MYQILENNEFTLFEVFEGNKKEVSTFNAWLYPKKLRTKRIFGIGHRPKVCVLTKEELKETIDYLSQKPVKAESFREYVLNKARAYYDNL